MSEALSIRNELFRKSIHICNSLFAYALLVFDQREFEGEGRLTGATYVMISSFFILLFFDKYVCIASILIMSYSDTSAAIIGKKYGKTKIFNKTLEGSLAFFFTSLIIILAIYPEVNMFLGLIAVFVATFVESLPIKMDDNLTVPLTIALILSI